MRTTLIRWFCPFVLSTACALERPVLFQGPTYDAASPIPTVLDAGNGQADAARPNTAPELGGPELVRDAGPILLVSDASAGALMTSPSQLGVCADDTPHGCYRARADNPVGCPPQIPEQSGFYPPLEEWLGCGSDWYVPCVYDRPDGSEASCACDLGFHWLCVY